MHIIVVDDDSGSRASVARFLKTMGHTVTQCGKVEEALAALRVRFAPIIFSDIRMPGESGLDLLREVSLLPADRRPKVVLFTGHGSLESAIEALRMGAYDYLLKPVKAEEFMAVITKIAGKIDAKSANYRGGKKEKPAQGADNEVRLGDGRIINIFSVKMQQVVDQALKYHTDPTMPILIQGETGTGKELIARLIHEGLTGTDAPFIDINCAALSPSLFESELFGYKGGAFTGGSGKDQEGKFDAARRGTIFLDEVAEIPVELQAKLLRVVEEREYYRVGGLQKFAVEARIICATNVNLLQAVNEGKFRRDLFYRLHVGEITLPPLRERQEDILPLALKLLLQLSAERGKSFKRIGREAEKALLNHTWPGNVRELKNVIAWAAFMYDEEELKPHHLKNAHLMNLRADVAEETALGCWDTSRSVLERHVDRLVQDAIQLHRGNKAAAARYLGISRRSLYRLLERVRPIDK